MSFIVDAVYENGTLKLDKLLPLKENERVKVTIQQEASIVDRTYGMIGWNVDPEVVERIAMDPEFEVGE